MNKKPLFEREQQRVFMSSGNLDIEEFTDRITELTALAWGEDWGTFTIEEPTGNAPEHILLPVITFDTHKRIRSTSHSSLDPVLFDSFRDPHDSNVQVKLYRMWFDVEVEFKIHHESNRAARMLMDEFEGFLFTYKSYLKELGISDMYFLSEEPPTVVTKWQKNFSQRTLRYLVRIERITTIRSNILNEVIPVRNESGRIVHDVTYDKNPLMASYRDQHRQQD